MTNGPVDAAQRAELSRRAIAAYEAMMATLMSAHQPEFLEIGITMSQAKVLYLLEAARGLHMAQLVSALGVSLSTVSGLVDRLVEQGLAVRHDDPADRRQVVVTPTAAAFALVERFRELNQRQLRSLLDMLADDELDTLVRALDALARVAAAKTRGVTEPAGAQVVAQTDSPDAQATPDASA
ncbi:MAG: MarR family winged helix-turn-helix transcriptional regulator [Acidimicrobiia bacterium]